MNVRALIDQVRGLKLEHENFIVTYRRAHAQAALAAPGQIVAIVGPTRVGKTTLSRRLSAELVKDKKNAEDRFIPLVRIEAATTNQGKFSTKHFTLRALEELADPVNIEGWAPYRRNQSETHLRIQLEQCIRYRETAFLLIDEAHHLLRTPSQVRAGEVLDTLKCLGNSTGLVTVLLGGYELLQTCFSSAHINGRLTVIDFPPYTPETSSICEFERILATFDSMLSNEGGSVLRDNRDLIYKGSLGCIGLLTGWVTSALAEMQARGDLQLKISHFQSTRLVEQIRLIQEEIDLGRHLLSQWDMAPNAGETVPLRPTKPKSKPFVRNPNRDPGPLDAN